jgi:hypothetical protein
LVVGEDALCCALGERLASAVLPGWTLARESINARGITKLAPSLPRYLEQARHVQPVICIADTDGRCPAELLDQWLGNRVEERFAFRLAVIEAESWLLADQESLADFLAVPAGKVPSCPDELTDPKRTVLALARRSKRRPIRTEVVSSSDPSKPGSGYNLHLGEYVHTRWRALRAAERSPSLARAIQRIQALGELPQ